MMAERPWWAPDAASVIAFTIIAIFARVYWVHPDDETLKGALIAAFAGAWGYYLGSSAGSKRAGDRADKAVETAGILATAAASPTTTTTTVTTEAGPNGTEQTGTALGAGGADGTGLGGTRTETARAAFVGSYNPGEGG